MHEKEFLQAISLAIRQYIDEINNLDNKDDANQKAYQILQNALSKENELRRKYDIGCRFKVINNQLKKLINDFSDNYLECLPESEQEITNRDPLLKLSPEETIVYVYLFNIQGKNISSWEKSLSPQLLDEYSINRPIYINLRDIQELLRSKSSSEYHSYLKVIIEKKYILTQEPIHNQYNHQLIRLKQNAIKREKIVSFHHQNQDYILSADNKLVVKP